MPKAPVKSPKNKREFGLAIPNLPAYFLLFAVVVSLYGLFVTMFVGYPNIVVINYCDYAA